MVDDGYSVNNVYQYAAHTHFKDDTAMKTNSTTTTTTTTTINNNNNNNNNSSSSSSSRKSNGFCVVIVDGEGREDLTDDENCERQNLNVRANSVTNYQDHKLNGGRTGHPKIVRTGGHLGDTCCNADKNLNASNRNRNRNRNRMVEEEETGPRLYNVNGKETSFESQEIHKTVVAFGMLMLNFLLTTTSLAVIHDKVPKYGPLPDAILDNVAARDWALIVSEILIIVTTAIMLIIIGLHPRRFVIFRRLFLLLSLLYLMRSVTMFVTVLPVSSRTYFCSPQHNATDLSIVLRRSLSLFFGMGLTINGKHIYCGDYIYSGHTTILVMSYLMISEYSCRRIYLLHWATWLMSFTGVLMVLISHSHYTVDVIVGYFVTTRLFWMYHTCANNPTLKHKSSSNCLSREWWFFLFQYFECNVEQAVQPLGSR